MNLRIAPTVKKMVRAAAKLNRSTLTDFVIRASQEAAAKVLADQTHFGLPEKQWVAFNAALEAPPKEIPALKTLFSRPSVFDEQPCSVHP
jgi:uncharacterized protein (DUF1778 family)